MACDSLGSYHVNVLVFWYFTVVTSSTISQSIIETYRFGVVQLRRECVADKWFMVMTLVTEYVEDLLDGKVGIFGELIPSILNKNTLL